MLDIVHTHSTSDVLLDIVHTHSTLDILLDIVHTHSTLDILLHIVHSFYIRHTVIHCTHSLYIRYTVNAVCISSPPGMAMAYLLMLFAWYPTHCLLLLLFLLFLLLSPLPCPVSSALTVPVVYIKRESKQYNYGLSFLVDSLSIFDTTLLFLLLLSFSSVFQCEVDILSSIPLWLHPPS